jgi:hypothetical protein
MDELTSDLADDGTAGPRPSGAPGWIKGFGIAVGILLVLFVALHLLGLAPDHHFGHLASHAVMTAKAARP